MIGSGGYRGRLKPFVPAIMRGHLDGLAAFEIRTRLWRDTGYLESTELISRVIKLETGRPPRKFWCRAQRGRMVSRETLVRRKTMPLDTTALETKPDLTVPTLEGLAWLLRRPAEWPQDFYFDYGTFMLRADEYRMYGTFAPASCGTVGCAGALAWMTWGDGEVPWTITRAMQGLLHIDQDTAFGIFARGAVDHRYGHSPITAAHVADRIDDYLAGRPIRE